MTRFALVLGLVAMLAGCTTIVIPTPTPPAATLPPVATPAATPVTTAVPTGEPTAEPTPEPTATPTPEPTAAPTDEPTLEPTATPTSSAEAEFPDAAEAALLEFVPEAFRDSCVRPFGEGVDVVADLDCFPTDLGADQVNYNQFATLEIMNESFDETRDFLGVPPSQGTCSDPEQWPADGTYSIDGEPAGRILCTDTFTGASIIWWTDELLNIKSVAISNEADREAVYQFWASDSGPVRP